MRHLVIFAKAPHFGAVKRRLARDIGRLAALQFYYRNLRSTVRLLSKDRRWNTFVAITGASTRWSNIIPHSVAILNQGGGDLGVRMKRVTEVMPLGPVIIVGSDVPMISRDNIFSAFVELGRKDLVLGPAYDGGYWLIGQARRRPMQAIFDNIRWSTENVIEDTLANLDCRHKYSIINTLLDVDDGQSYATWKRDKCGLGEDFIR